MKITADVTTVLVAACVIVTSSGEEHASSCCSRDVSEEAIAAFSEFDIRLYKQTVKQYNNHFAISQYEVWFTLAAMAEGATGYTQQQLFSVLGLPAEECLRQKYYDVLRSLVKSGPDATFTRSRTLAVDEKLQHNEAWAQKVLTSGLLNNISYVPIRSAPQIASERMAQYIGSRYPVLDVDFAGNSVLLNTLDFDALWTTAFPEARIEPNAPFYNEFGVRIGSVDFLHMTARVKLSFLPKLNAKILILPVGVGGRYSFLFFQHIGAHSIQRSVEFLAGKAIYDTIANAKESKIPLEIAVPRLNIKLQIDNMRDLLESLGVYCLWRNPETSSLVSTPPALPSAYVQRVSLKLDSAGVQPYIQPELTESAVTQLETGLATFLGRDFIGNRPFLFALIETAHNTTLFSGAFSKPYLNNV